VTVTYLRRFEVTARSVQPGKLERRYERLGAGFSLQGLGFGFRLLHCEQECRLLGRLGGTYRLHHQGKRIRELRMLAVTINAVPSSLTLFTLMMDTIRSFETSVLARATCSHIP
jgi:hypothetical protein